MTQFKLIFDEPPTNEELRLAVESCGLSTYRFTSTSPDKLEYEVESVNLKPNTITGEQVAVPARLRCENCGHIYTGWQVRRKDHFDYRLYNYPTYYCPRCPPVVESIWIRDKLGIRPDKPDLPTYQPTSPKQQPETTINIDDYD